LLLAQSTQGSRDGVGERSVGYDEAADVDGFRRQADLLEVVLQAVGRR